MPDVNAGVSASDKFIVTEFVFVDEHGVPPPVQALLGICTTFVCVVVLAVIGELPQLVPRSAAPQVYVKSPFATLGPPDPAAEKSVVTCIVIAPPPLGVVRAWYEIVIVFVKLVNGIVGCASVTLAGTEDRFPSGLTCIVTV